MRKYKIYERGNYIYIVNISTTPNEFFRGAKKDVFVDKSNLNKPNYRFFNVKDFRDKSGLNISQIFKEDGSPYTETEFDIFYETFTKVYGASSSSNNIESLLQELIDEKKYDFEIINWCKEGADVVTEIKEFDAEDNTIVPTSKFYDINNVVIITDAITLKNDGYVVCGSKSISPQIEVITISGLTEISPNNYEITSGSDIVFLAEIGTYINSIFTAESIANISYSGNVVTIDSNVSLTSKYVRINGFKL